MHVGLTYDLKSAYLAMGVSPEDAAEFDKEETIDGIETALRELGHETDRIGHAKALIKRLEAGDRWDIVFNICEGLHGVAREAQVPAILDLYGVPYVFSDPLVLALTLHKGLTKRVVRDAGVPTSDFCVYETAEDLGGLRFGAPFFVKPVAEGTGKGCSSKSIVRDRAALAGVCDELVARFGQPALIEPYLAGREFTVGITGTDGNYTIGGLSAGMYWVSFEDFNGVYFSEVYDNAFWLGSGSNIVVGAETTVAGIDASLERIPDPVPPVIVGLNAVGLNAWSLLYIGTPGDRYIVQESVTPTNIWNDVGSSFVCESGTEANKKVNHEKALCPLRAEHPRHLPLRPSAGWPQPRGRARL